MKTKLEIAKDWLPRYTGTPVDQFADYILLTNFKHHLDSFQKNYDCVVHGAHTPMQTATSKDNITMIHMGIGSANAATIMDLLIARNPKGILLLGKCGGLKKSSEIGHFILPIGAIRGEGTSLDYMPAEVPALPSFKLHKFVSEKLREHKLDYRTGVIYTTNRRLWEWDQDFLQYLLSLSAIAIDMETATIFIVGHKNHLPRGALLLVSDVPTHPEGIKTQKSDEQVTEKYSELHLKIGIESMKNIGKKGEMIKHFGY